MKTKKIVKGILAVLCALSVILAGAENPDGSCNLAWTLSWLAIAANCGIWLRWLEEEGAK